MFAVPFVLLAAAVQASIARAETATILPVGFDVGSDGIEGEIIGTGVLPGGVAGTTYVLSGVAAGVAFTLTLAEGASLLAETVDVPALTIDDEVACDFTAFDAAICVINRGTSATTVTNDASFQLIPVSTPGADASASMSAPSSQSPSPSGTATSIPSNTASSNSAASVTGSAASSSVASVISGLSTATSGSAASSPASPASSPGTISSSADSQTVGKLLNPLLIALSFILGTLLV